MTASASARAVDDAAPTAVAKRPIVAACIGNGIEWLDYSVYGYLAPTLGVLFFPSDDPTTSLLASFAVFGLTFAIRPLGAVFFGSLGDRIGRKQTLATIVLLMSACTFLVGILPTFATVGVLAPALLVVLRLGQGLSAGGETGTAYTFLTEYAPQGRRGFFNSFGNVSAFAGALFGSAMVTVGYLTLGDPGMESWGWRIPFLIAGPLGIVGLYLRLKLEDTPHFRALEKDKQVDEAPLRDALRTHWRAIIRVGLIGAMHGVGFYTVLTYMPSFLTEQKNVGSTWAFVASSVGLIVAIVVLPLAGGLSDRIGRRPVTIGACVAYVVAAYPIFLLLAGDSVGTALLSLAAIGLIFGVYASAPFAFMAELFPTKVRVSAYSLGYNVFNALLGGSTPFIATYLADRTGDPLSPAFYVMICAVLALGAAALSPETAKGALRKT